MRRRLTHTLTLLALVTGLAVAGCGGADTTSGPTNTTETTAPAEGTDGERDPSTPIEADGYRGFRFTPEAWGERDPGTGEVLTGLYQASEADVAAAEGSLPAAFGESARPEAKSVLERFDEYTRQSRRVLLWFLLQHPPDWEAHRRQFTRQEKALRRAGQRWYELAPPFTKPFVAAKRSGEQPCLSVAEIAVILRASETSIDLALQRDDFPLPPAQSPPPRWTREQLDRFLGPPSPSR